uniref:hypothetical protein n=1 Tax=Xanthomonas albilineans TaxID=29447 RepID=UPI0027DC19EA|nr:hypothetical protein [Xanthomonas albilineans]
MSVSCVVDGGLHLQYYAGDGLLSACAPFDLFPFADALVLDLVLTADQWVDVITACRAAARPLQLARRDGAEEHGDQVRSTNTGLVGKQVRQDQAGVDVHVQHVACARACNTTMIDLSFGGTP